MKKLFDREDAKTAKKNEGRKTLGLNRKRFAVLRELRVFAVKEVLV